MSERFHRLVIFSFEKGSPEDGQEWLQITSVSNIGNIGSDIKQKIIRIDEEDQKKLLTLLYSKFKN